MEYRKSLNNKPHSYLNSHPGSHQMFIEFILRLALNPLIEIHNQQSYGILNHLGM